MNILKVDHFFSQRIYIIDSDTTKLEDAEKIIRNQGNELYGAGIRSYSKPIGFLLSILGFASKIEIDQKEFYINNKSFAKLCIRKKLLGEQTSSPLEKETSPMEYTAKALHDCYLDKKIEYKENELNDLIKTQTKDTNNQILNLSVIPGKRPILPIVHEKVEVVEPRDNVKPITGKRFSQLASVGLKCSNGYECNDLRIRYPSSLKQGGLFLYIYNEPSNPPPKQHGKICMFTTEGDNSFKGNDPSLRSFVIIDPSHLTPEERGYFITKLEADEIRKKKQIELERIKQHDNKKTPPRIEPKESSLHLLLACLKNLGENPAIVPVTRTQYIDKIFEKNTVDKRYVGIEDDLFDPSDMPIGVPLQLNNIQLGKMWLKNATPLDEDDYNMSTMSSETPRNWKTTLKDSNFYYRVVNDKEYPIILIRIPNSLGI